jgi:hypothetical protein
MGYKAGFAKHATAIAPLWRGFATRPTACRPPKSRVRVPRGNKSAIPYVGQMKHPYPILVLLLLHLSLSVAALLWVFGVSSAHFEGHRVPPLSAYAANGLFAATWFPLSLLRLPSNSFPGVLGWIPVVGNSLLWAGFLTWALQCIRAASQTARTEEPTNSR